MLTATTYPNPLDNPELIAQICEALTEPVNLLLYELLAESLRERGYQVTVTEGRMNTPNMEIPEVKFAENPETGGTEGIDTSHGHRWTISYNQDRGGYNFMDRKLGIVGHVPDLLTAKGMAARAVSNETDNTPVQSYGQESGLRPYAGKIEPTPVETLRKLFPGHYLTK